MPLYRQVGIFGRDGVDLDCSTLCDWAGITAWWLKPVWELMVSTVLSTSPKLFCDDTYLPVMAKGKTHKGALFGYARDDSPWDGPLSPAVVYSLHRRPQAQQSVASVAPFVYLRDVLERIVSGETKANQLEVLLPWNWRPASDAIVAQAA